jgi:hypothetical protein
MWEGQPNGGLLLRAADLYLIPFSLLWGGFAIYWNFSVWTAPFGGEDWSFKLFGLPFLILGLYFIIGRFLVDIALRQRLTYLVTDRRIVVLGPSSTSVKSLDIKRLPALEFSERRDGSGTLRFEAGSGFSGRNFGVWQPTFDPALQFLRIADARHVYELVQRLAA